MSTATHRSIAGRASAIWGVLGVVVFLLQAVLRLLPIAREGCLRIDAATTWLGLVAWVAFMAYAEGYRGFHQRFSPRVVARAIHLAQHPTLFRALFAPLFCMSLFGATARGMRVARLLLVGIVALVVAMRWVAQPWRGIVDAGVVVGLGLGLLSIVRALLGVAPTVDADIPRRAERTLARTGRACDS